jgi:E3 ubiquitin-protein ligase RNF5
MHPTAGGMLGGMAVAVLPLVLRGQAQPPGMYYSGTYHLMNPRQRRVHMEVEMSLHQIWFFLFVFVALCLLLF